MNPRFRGAGRCVQPIRNGRRQSRARAPSGARGAREARGGAAEGDSGWYVRTGRCRTTPTSRASCHVPLDHVTRRKWVRIPPRHGSKPARLRGSSSSRFSARYQCTAGASRGHRESSGFTFQNSPIRENPAMAGFCRVAAEVGGPEAACKRGPIAKKCGQRHALETTRMSHASKLQSA
jgi:hypothetical protein